MARPKSEDKRNAILACALQVFAEHGLGAPTARIAKGAAVAEGTLFNYFETKDDLLNQLYLELKVELRDVMLPGFPHDADIRERIHHAWHTYVGWGVAHPAKRKAMALLSMSDRVTEHTKVSGSQIFSAINLTMQESVESGVFRDVSPNFIAAIMRTLAETTMDFMSAEPEQAEYYCEAGFQAYWNAIARETI